MISGRYGFPTVSIKGESEKGRIKSGNVLSIDMANQIWMKVPIEKDLPEYLQFWALQYPPNDLEKDKKHYFENIVSERPKYYPLMEWKMTASGQDARQKFADAAKKFCENPSSDILNAAAKSNAPVLKAFLLHLHDPAKFPILDQHAFRAIQFLSCNFKDVVKPSRWKLDWGDISEVPKSFTVKWNGKELSEDCDYYRFSENVTSLTSYFPKSKTQELSKYFNEDTLLENEENLLKILQSRYLDRALFCLGKALLTPYGSILKENGR